MRQVRARKTYSLDTSTIGSGERMAPSLSYAGSVGDRRAAERRDCDPGTTGWVTDVLEQQRWEAGAWNLSTGGAGLILGSHLSAGVRVAIELHHPEREYPLFVWAEVKHAICCPSSNEMWLTGCSFLDGIPGEELHPFA